MKHYLLRSSLLSVLVCALLVAGLLGATVPTRAASRQAQTTHWTDASGDSITLAGPAASVLTIGSDSETESPDQRAYEM